MWLVLSALASAGTHLVSGYSGHTVVHPGVHIRPERAVGPWRLGAELGTYLHPGNQVAVWLLPRAGLQRPGKRQGLYELALGIGALRSFWTAPAFAVVDGELERRPLAGDTYATARLDVGLGRRTDEAALHSWMLRPALALRLPHAAGMALDLSLCVDLDFGGGR